MNSDWEAGKRIHDLSVAMTSPLCIGKLNGSMHRLPSRAANRIGDSTWT